MNPFENINISFSYDPLFLYLGLILLIFYTVFIYRITLPDVGPAAKSLLIFLRSTSLFLILILIFDPLLRITSERIVEPQTIILVDNSKSISEYADSAQLDKLRELNSGIKSSLGSNADIISFGESFNELKDYTSDALNFSESSTQLEKAGEIFRNYKEISSIVLISDGIFNQGLDPLNSLSNINVPVYTVGIGDSSSYPDLSIERIRNNSTIYAEKESDIEVVVLSNDPSVNSTEIQIYDNNDLFFTKKFEISESGINRIIVPYLTAKEGKHQIRVVVNPLPGEKNSKNNSKSVLINVLASKKSIAVISGAPGRDLSAVVKSIKSNEDFSLYQITELGNGKYYNDERDTEKIRNADAVFLIGFPSQNSNDAFADEIFNIISSEKKNIFMAPGFDFDYVFVNKLSSGFPISFSAIQSRLLESQVKAQSSFTGLLGSNTEMLSEWSDLPPVTLPENGLTIDGQHDILLTDNLERPVMFSGSYSGKKIIFLNCINFWRWKLMSPFDENPVFDNMIFNSIKWLSLSTNDFFTVEVSKENFILGEEIYFKANLYSSTFEPLSNENISLEVYNESYNEKYTFSPQGSGIYDLNIKVPKPGIYNFIAEVSDSSSNISPVKGTLNIDQLELEFADQTMKKNLLTAISENSGGKYYDINNTVNLLSELKSNYENKIYNEKIDKELRLSNFELILFLLVLFFSIEWIIRKFLQMI